MEPGPRQIIYISTLNILKKLLYRFYGIVILAKVK